MSHEAYTAPVQIADPTANSGSSAQQYTNSGFGAGVGGVDRGTPYRCGDCNAQTYVKRGDAVRCKECGYRVLYKERTNRIVQFEAR